MEKRKEFSAGHLTNTIAVHLLIHVFCVCLFTDLLSIHPGGEFLGQSVYICSTLVDSAKQFPKRGCISLQSHQKCAQELPLLSTIATA